MKKKKTHFNRYVGILGIHLKGKIVLKQTYSIDACGIGRKNVSQQKLRSIEIISAMWFVLPTSPRSDKYKLKDFLQNPSFLRIPTYDFFLANYKLFHIREKDKVISNSVLEIIYDHVKRITTCLKLSL